MQTHLLRLECDKRKTTHSSSKQHQIRQAHVWFGEIDFKTFQNFRLVFFALFYIQYIQISLRTNNLYPAAFYGVLTRGQVKKKRRQELINLIYHVHLFIKSTKLYFTGQTVCFSFEQLTDDIFRIAP